MPETVCIAMTDSTRLTLSLGLGLSVDTGGYSWGGFPYGLEHGHSLTLTLLLQDIRTRPRHRIQTGFLITGMLGLARREEYYLPRDWGEPFSGHYGHGDIWIRHDLLSIGPALLYECRSRPLEVIISYGFNWTTWEMHEELYSDGPVEPDDGHSLLIILRNRNLMLSVGRHDCRSLAHPLGRPLELRAAIYSIGFGFIIA